MNFGLLLLGIVFQLLVMHWCPPEAMTGLKLTAAAGLAIGLSCRSGKAFSFPLGAALCFMGNYVLMLCWYQRDIYAFPRGVFLTWFPALLVFGAGAIGVSVALVISRVFSKRPAAEPEKKP